MSDKHKIIPGIRVGKYYLGMSINELLNNLSKEHINYQIQPLNNPVKIKTSNITFWIKDDLIDQIMVHNNFSGKFRDFIGIGSTLSDVLNFVGNWKSGYYDIAPIYVLVDVPGICFELEDEDYWDEKEAPIKYISIYPDQTDPD